MPEKANSHDINDPVIDNHLSRRKFLTGAIAVASPPVSHGYIDVDEIAPWDTWIEAIDGYVLTWVPKVFVSLVADAIMVNPEECIRWASDWKHPTVRQYDAWFRRFTVSKTM